MSLIKTFIMKCKQRVVSVFDDSNNYKTAVEEFMDELEDAKPAKINFEDDNAPNYRSLYSEPHSDYIQEVISKSSVDNSKVYKHTDEVNQEEFLSELNVEAPQDSRSILKSDVNSDVSDNHCSIYEVETKKLVDKDNTSSKVEDIENVCDNSKFISSLVSLIEELDAIYNQSKDENVYATIEFSQNRIIEILLANNCTTIEEITSFNSLYHITRPFQLIDNGTKINSILRAGIIYNGKVLLKAIVKLEKG